MTNIIKKQNIKSNFIYQFLYQCILLIVPLITAPYLTRILGDTALGNYTYINSIAYYFVLFANLGITKYGQRLIAKKDQDIIGIRKAFWSLFFLHAMLSIIALVFYFSFILLAKPDNINIYYIEGLYVASALFDITWLFYGLENFKGVVIKSLIVKIIEVALIFILLKTSSDIWIYALITASSILVSQSIILIGAIRNIKPIRFDINDIKVHIKPLITFSIIVISISLYTVFDKTLLGWLSSKENVAYYEYAEKIILIPKTFITVIGTVMLPRACKLLESNDTKEYKKNIENALYIASLIGIATIFLLLAISRKLAIVFYGESFKESGYVMMAMCVIPIIVGIGEVIRTQYLIPKEKDKEYLICIVLNATVNVILSTILIPILGIYGAVIGSVAAELFGLIFQLSISKGFISAKVLLKTMVPFIVIGLCMYLVIILISRIMNTTSIVSLLIELVSGILVYYVLSVIYFTFIKKKLKPINN